MTTLLESISAIFAANREATTIVLGAKLSESDTPCQHELDLPAQSHRGRQKPMWFAKEAGFFRKQGG